MWQRGGAGVRRVGLHRPAGPLALDSKTVALVALLLGVGGLVSLCVSGHSVIAASILLAVGVAFGGLLLAARRAARRRR